MSPRPFTRLLVANRGEIAVRIIRTARRMGLTTVAIYSDADRHAPHVRLADAAFRIGPAPAAQSYLDIGAILAAARSSGAEAIHPGYGFLSENADFAAAIEAAGLVFIGPPVEAIRAMGSKSAAKALMEKAGVPTVPGYHGEDQSLAVLSAAAERIGYPVLIKASAGGGGKGMKIVRAPANFEEALASARREAKNAFGDDRVLIERSLARPRHIEVQVFADTFGETVHLFDRDCSIQRRHQKVVEEAPAPGLSAERRATMGAAAVAAARAVGYVGAGTVEFIVEGEAFYFLEMNTRLQVEHPVTEAITGQDLVEWQIRVARGERLPLSQQGLVIHGHAVEARLYAEDPARDFLPQTGILRHFRWPEGGGIRVDTGIAEGDTVTMFYDPLLAKIIALGTDRAEAIGRLQTALSRTEVAGVATNLGFLRRIAGHPAFAAAKLDTGFIERHGADLLPAPGPVPDDIVAIAAFWVLREEGRERIDPADPSSPWDAVTGWRPNLPSRISVDFADRDRRLAVAAEGFDGAWRVRIGDATIEVRGRAEADGSLDLFIGARRLGARVFRDGLRLDIVADGDAYVLDVIDPYAVAIGADQGAGRLDAPMPGTVTRLSAEVGARVAKGAVLVVIEAMKMEHLVVAPRDGVVTALRCRLGDVVAAGATLLAIGDAAAE